jgi:hypothetical protein
LQRPSHNPFSKKIVELSTITKKCLFGHKEHKKYAIRIRQAFIASWFTMMFWRVLNNTLHIMSPRAVEQNLFSNNIE